MTSALSTTIMLSTIVPIVLGVVVTIVVLLWVRKFLGNVTGADLRGTGVPAQATIIRIWDTGTTINDNPVVGFLLEVHPANQPAYQAETKSMIPRLAIPQFQPGATVPVKIDPANLTRVAIALGA
jgi:hypothetical protein